MQVSAPVLYLDLLKSCLTDVIYADHPLATVVPAGVATHRRWTRGAVRLAGALAERLGFMLVEPQRTPFASHAGLDAETLRALRSTGSDWPPRAHTMIGLKRLDNLQYCIETVLREGVPGDFIETGVWRGGASIFMRGALHAYDDPDRVVWVADSFQGLPPPDPGRYPADRGDTLHRIDFLAVPRHEVEANFRAYGLLDDRVRFLEGWFEHTLPTAPIDRLAVLRFDGDMYSSTTQVLESLYHKVSPGGFIIIDDYSLDQCRAAVHDFRRVERIETPMEKIDGMGAFWRKPFDVRGSRGFEVSSCQEQAP